MAKLRDKHATGTAQPGPEYDWRTIPLEKLIGAEALAKWKAMQNAPVDHTDLFNELEEIGRSVPIEVWQELPPDYLWNLDHYLYGHPKRDKE